MIPALAVGMRLMLPSGNIVALVRRDRAQWICEYTMLARARGEVAFSEAFLRRFGRQV